MFHRLWCSLQKKFPELLRCYGRAGVVWHGLASAGDLVPVLMPVVASCRGKALAQKRFSLGRGSESNGVIGFFQNPLLRNYHPTTRGEQPHN